MFEDVDQQMEEAKEDEKSFSNCTSLEQLLVAVADKCYICSNIFNQLEDENAIDRLKSHEPPLLLRRGWRNALTSEVGATILRNVQLDDIPTGVTEWQYRLIRASQQDDRFGFDFKPASPEGTKAVHRLYQDIPFSTCSDQAAALTRRWYQNCRNGHDKCRDTLPWMAEGTAMSAGVRYGMVEPNGASATRWYPPRLLDVSADVIRLLSRRQIQQCPPFAALSHCWGLIPFLTLTSSNIQRFESEGIEYATLPENFRNVVDVCRWLHIRYLWIDSLCIIQQGPGSKADWDENIDGMRYIYSSCDICISTAATDGDTKSCFVERDPTTIAAVCVMTDDTPNLLIGMDHSIRGFRNAPIASRAWVLQERLLSRRILTFGPKQVFWECCETAGRNVCETFPQGLPPYGYSRGPFLLPSPKEYGRPETPSVANHRKWLDLIETYCECNLTKRHEDKLVALGGIAQQMQSVFGGSTYIAGFFMFELPAALLCKRSSMYEMHVRQTLTLYTYL